MAARKVFLDHLYGSVEITGTPVVSHNNLMSHLAQEDEELIGCSISAEVNEQSENDGQANCAFEVSTEAVHSQPGCIVDVSAKEKWNTTPAFGFILDCNETVMFPIDRAIQIKEEGKIYLNAVGTGKTAGTSRFGCVVHLYLLRKGR